MDSEDHYYSQPSKGRKAQYHVRAPARRGSSSQEDDFDKYGSQLTKTQEALRRQRQPSNGATPAFLQDRQAKQDAALVYPPRYIERDRERDDQWRKRIESRPAVVQPGGWSHTGDRGSEARSRSRSRERPSFHREGTGYLNAGYNHSGRPWQGYNYTGIPWTSPGIQGPALPPLPPLPQQTGQAPIIINNRIYTRDDSLSDDSNASDEDRRNGDGTNIRDGRRRRSRKNDKKRGRGGDKPSSDAHGASVASGAQRVLSTNGVNAIWDPTQNTDLTIHLKLPLKENLEEKLDEFCRLRRRGDYASARRFFTQELLPEHEDDPYLLVQYAEMLLEQGDYATLASLNGHKAFSPGSPLEKSKDGMLLRIYWHMMQVERSAFNTPIPWESFPMIPEALKALHDSIKSNGQNPVGSTQIKLLWLLLSLTCVAGNALVQNDWLRRHVWDIFPVSFHRRLYQDLLREGRVWDFYDIFLGVSNSIGRKEAAQCFVVSTDNESAMQSLLDDWIAANGAHDSATLLALLNIVMYSGTSDNSMKLAKQLALTIMESHPQEMGTDIFLQWMLSNAEYTIRSDKAQVDGFHKHLKAAPGLLEHYGWEMPTYIPVDHENPGWRAADAPAECQTVAQSVLDHGKRLGSYSTQADALRVLILISKEPAKEIGELCSLQKMTQGNMNGYYCTLPASYLALDQEASTYEPQINELKNTLRGICFDREGLTNVYNKFLVCLFLHSIEDESEGAEKALEEAFYHSQFISASELEGFEEKMPDLRLKRLEYLKNNISSSNVRREAEYGLRAAEREREALGVSEFPELDLEPLRDHNDVNIKHEGVAKRVMAETRVDEKPIREEEEAVRYHSEEDGYDYDQYKGRKWEESRRRRFRREREKSRERWEEAMKEVEEKRAEETKRELRRVRGRIDKLKMQRTQRQGTEGSEEEREHIRIRESVGPSSSRPPPPPRPAPSSVQRGGGFKYPSPPPPPEDGVLKQKEEAKATGEISESTKIEELLKKKQAAVEELRREEEERRRLETLEKELLESEQKLTAERQLREEAERRLTQRWHKVHDRHQPDGRTPTTETRKPRDNSRRLESPDSQDSHDTSVGAPDPPQFGAPSTMPQMRRPPRHAILRVKRMRTPPLVIQVDHPSSPSTSSASSPAWASSDEELASQREYPRGRQLDPVVEEVDNDSDEGGRYHAHVEEMDDSDDPAEPPSQAAIQGLETTDPDFEEPGRDGDRESHDPTWDDPKVEELGPEDSVSATGGTNGHLHQQNGKAKEASREKGEGASSKLEGS